jgi:hypothetical protein
MGAFTDIMQKLCGKAQVDVKTALHKIADEAFKRVVLRTPVRTGNTRANWSVVRGPGSPVPVLADTDASGSGTIKKADSSVDGWDGDGAISLCNSLPFVRKLENGSSTEAPQGMVKLTLAEMAEWIKNPENLRDSK